MKTLKRVLIVCFLLIVPFFLQAEDHFGFGFGLTTDNINLNESGFTIPLSNLYFESSISGILIGTVNMYGYMGFIPEIEVNAGFLIPVSPLEVKLTLGLFDDIIISGHAGVMLTASVIIDKSIELKIFGVFRNSSAPPQIVFQEGIVDGKFVKNDDGRGDLSKGYAGLLLGIRY